jgi:hypothetical protein
MSLVDLLTTEAPTPLRRPVFEISLGGGADSGGLGGLADAVGALVGAAADPWIAHVSRIVVVRTLAPTADFAEVDLSPGAAAPDVAIGDSGSVGLGFTDDGPATVYTGKVFADEVSIDGARRLSLGNASGVLCRTRRNATYQQQSIADLIKAILGDAGVASGNVDIQGPKLPFYVVDDRSTLYEHIARLAVYAGAIAAVSADDEVHVTPLAAGEVVDTFRYGDDVLALQRDEDDAPRGLRWIGEGAAGSQGGDAWSWLLKSADGMAVGDSSAPTTYAGALRSREAVDAAAEGLRVGDGHAVRLVVAGAPAVAPGTTIEVTDSPEHVWSGSAVVTSVRHEFDQRRGFITRLEAVELPSEGAGLLGGLL